MPVVPPPQQPYRYRWGSSEPAERHAPPPVLGERALRGHTDAPSGRDDGQPVVDVLDVLDVGPVLGRPEVEGRGTRAGVDGEDTVTEVDQTELATRGQRVVRGECAVARLQADDGAVEPAVEPAGATALRGWRGADDRDVAGSLGQAPGRGVGAHQQQRHGRVLRGPAALELDGVRADGRPGVSHAQWALPGTGLPGQVVDLGHDPACPGQHSIPRRGEDDLAAGSPQQAYPQDVLQLCERAGDRRLRDAEHGGGAGETTRIDDRDQAAQVAQLHIHASSVSVNSRMHFENAIEGAHA